LKLYVARHSDAGAFIPGDPKAERERTLTPNGVRLAKAVGAKMKSAGQVPSVIFSSPLERAKQTADIIGAKLKVQVNIIDDLAPNRPLEDRVLELIKHRQVKRAMLVGHHDNTTPAFDNFGGDMGDSLTDDDDEDDFDDWPPLVKAELRKLRIDRDSGNWKCVWRVMPSSLGFSDDMQ
jgi:phosphohistidine phosphatase